MMPSTGHTHAFNLAFTESFSCAGLMKDDARSLHGRPIQSRALHAVCLTETGFVKKLSKKKIWKPNEKEVCLVGVYKSCHITSFPSQVKHLGNSNILVLLDMLSLM